MNVLLAEMLRSPERTAAARRGRRRTRGSKCCCLASRKGGDDKLQAKPPNKVKMKESELFEEEEEVEAQNNREQVVVCLSGAAKIDQLEEEEARRQVPSSLIASPARSASARKLFWLLFLAIISASAPDNCDFPVAAAASAPTTFGAARRGRETSGPPAEQASGEAQSGAGNELGDGEADELARLVAPVPSEEAEPRKFAAANARQQSDGQPTVVVASRWQNELYLPCKLLNLMDEDQTVRAQVRLFGKLLDRVAELRRPINRLSNLLEVSRDLRAFRNSSDST